MAVATKGFRLNRFTDVERQINATFLRRLSTLLEDSPPERVEPALADLDIGREALSRGTPDGIELHRLLDRLNAADRLPGVCLRFGLARTILDLGLIGYTVLSCRDLGSALDVIYRYHGLTSAAYQVHLAIDEDWMTFRLWIRPANRTQQVVIAEEFVTGLWTAVSELLPDSINTGRIRIDFNFPAPSYADLYLDLMPGEIRFAQHETRVAIPADWLKLTVETADDTVERICRTHCDQLLEDMAPKQGIVDDVQRLLLSVPSNRRLSLDDVADLMMTSPRTLERRLQSAGSTFRTVQTEVRMELAAQYVGMGSISIDEIGRLLGYSQPSALYRAFKQTFGMTPKQYRLSRSA